MRSYRITADRQTASTVFTLETKFLFFDWKPIDKFIYSYDFPDEAQSTQRLDYWKRKYKINAVINRRRYIDNVL